MDSIFLLVEWIGEGKYSSVSHSAIVDEAVKLLSYDNLLGQTTAIRWGKSKVYQGVIHQYGPKTDMDFEASVYAKTSGSKKMDGSETVNTQSSLPSSAKKRPNSNDQHNSVQKKVANETTLSQLTNVLSEMDGLDVNEVQNETEFLNKDNEIIEETIAAKLAKAKLRVKKYKDLARTRKLRIQELESQLENMIPQENDVAIADNVFVSKEKLDTIKTISDTPNIFARNLMRVLFNAEEMIGHSMFGNPSNAFKDSRPIAPSLDPVRRDAVIVYTMKMFGQEVVNIRKRKRPLLNDLRRSMGDFLREQTLKNKKEANNQV